MINVSKDWWIGVFFLPQIFLLQPKHERIQTDLLFSLMILHPLLACVGKPVLITLNPTIILSMPDSNIPHLDVLSPNANNTDLNHAGASPQSWTWLNGGGIAPLKPQHSVGWNTSRCRMKRIDALSSHVWDLLLFIYTPQTEAEEKEKRALLFTVEQISNTVGWRETGSC